MDKLHLIWWHCHVLLSVILFGIILYSFIIFLNLLLDQLFLFDWIKSSLVFLNSMVMCLFFDLELKICGIKLCLIYFFKSNFNFLLPQTGLLYLKEVMWGFGFLWNYLMDSKIFKFFLFNLLTLKIFQFLVAAITKFNCLQSEHPHLKLFTLKYQQSCSYELLHFSFSLKFAKIHQLSLLIIRVYEDLNYFSILIILQFDFCILYF